MKLKLDANGNVVVVDGKPVYVHDDGTEVAFDAKAANVQIATLSRENAQHRTANKDLAEKWSVLGDADPAEVAKAYQFAKSLDGKKVFDDEAVQKAVAAAVKPLQDQIAAKDKTIGDLNGEIYTREISNSFATSEVLKKTAYAETPEILEAYFKNSFKVENGKAVAYGPDGNMIYSTKNPGQPASFDEAVTFLINNHPKKDHILKGTGHVGSGSQGTKQQQMSKDTFDSLPPAQRLAEARRQGMTE